MCKGTGAGESMVYSRNPEKFSSTVRWECLGGKGG